MLALIMLQAVASAGIAQVGAAIGAGLAVIGAGLGIGKIGSAAIGYPIIVIISISDIVPPPIGTALTNNVATNATPNICKTLPILEIFVPNKHTKNIILNTEPIIEPSLWKLVPIGIVVSAISSGTPIFFAHSTFIGIEAALEHVAKDVTVGGIIFFQKALTPFFPADINAYNV